MFQTFQFTPFLHLLFFIVRGFRGELINELENLAKQIDLLGVHANQQRRPSSRRAPIDSRDGLRTEGGAGVTTGARGFGGLGGSTGSGLTATSSLLVGAPLGRQLCFDSERAGNRDTCAEGVGM